MLNNSKKLKKLTSNPVSFFCDFASKWLSRDNFGDLSYSLVVAYKNSDNVKRCIDSIFSQSLLPSKNFEIILLPIGEDVNLIDIHGPRGCSVVGVNTRFSNLAAAYNFAISIAKNDYIKFIDDESLLGKNFFDSIQKVIVGRKGPFMALLNSVSLTSERGDPYKNANVEATLAGNKIVNVEKSPVAISLSLRSTSFFIDVIKSEGIKFDVLIPEKLIGPEFCSCYFNKAARAHKEVAHVKNADLLWTNTSPWEKEVASNLEDLSFGKTYIDIISNYFSSGKENIFLKNSHFNFLLNLVDSVVAKRKIDEKLGELDKKYIAERLKDVLHLFGEDYIKKYSGPNCKFFHRVGLLGFCEFPRQSSQIAYVEDYDFRNGLVRFKYYTSVVGVENFLINGISVIPNNAKTRHHSLLGFKFCEERIVWVKAGVRHTASLKIELGGCQKVKISFANKGRDDCKLGEVIQYFKNKNKPLLPLPAKAKVLRFLARTYLARQKFKDAWLITDNDIKADDNGEHFYRYLMNSQPKTRSYFLINKDTVEWKRLKSEGFKLIPFGSLYHKLALLNCKYLISSHANPAVVSFLPKKHFGDMLNYDFIFLQHGVTKDDQSDWLNSRDIRLLVTAAVPEHEDISGNGRYKYTKREVVLTGFPRHDSLVSSSSSDKLILIMPTWRKSLSGPLLKKSSLRQKNPLFNTSLFYKNWTALISSPELKRYCDEHGYKIAFFPHPNIMAYMDEMHLPEYIETYNAGDASIQELFQRASMIVTDFSSVAFELAYMYKPVVYFQFDIDEFFAEHSYTRGYYDYERDGFGPVCYTEDSAVRAIGELISKDCIPDEEYSSRMRNFFPYRDGKCSERTYLKIKALDEFDHSSDADPAVLYEAARLASHDKNWKLAADRWQSILDLEKDAVQAELIFNLIEAKRHLGEYAEVPSLLKLCEQKLGKENKNILLEEAELASASADWPMAAKAWQRILEQDCASEYALLKLIEAYRHQGETTLVSLELNRYPVEKRMAVEYRIEHAYYQNALENWEAAAEEWSILVQEHSSALPEDAKLMLAEAQQRLNLLDSAHELLTFLLKKSPKNLRFIQRIYEIEFCRERWANVEKYGLQLEKLSPLDFLVDDVLKLAISQIKLKKYTLAEKRLKAIHEICPSDLRISKEIFNLYIIRRRWSDVIELVSKVDPVFLDFDKNRLLLAGAYFEVEQFDSARRELNIFKKSNPHDVSAAMLELKVNYVLKDLNAAPGWFRSAAEWDKLEKKGINKEKLAPLSWKDEFELAVAQVNLGKYASAESRLLKAYKKKPDSFQVGIELVGLYYVQKRWSKLVEVASIIDQNILESGKLRLMLATAYLSLGQIEDARQQLALFAKTNQKTVDFDIVKARFAYVTRDWDTSIGLLVYLIDQHRELLPPDAPLMLVKSLRQKGLMQQAQKVLYKEAEYVCHTALEREPFNVKVLEEYAALIGKSMLIEHLNHSDDELKTIYAND